jgi:hypothetical protein
VSGEQLYWWAPTDRWIVVADDEHGISRQVRDATEQDVRTLPFKGGEAGAARGYGPPYVKNAYYPVAEEVDEDG